MINPKPATIAEYERRQEARRRLERQLARLRALPATTVDGIRISLQANIELPRDLEAAQRSGAEGVGLCVLCLGDSRLGSHSRLSCTAR